MKTLGEIIDEQKAIRHEEGIFGIRACKKSIRREIENTGKTLDDLLDEYVKRANTDIFFNQAMVLACVELRASEKRKEAEQFDRKGELDKLREYASSALLAELSTRRNVCIFSTKKEDLSYDSDMDILIIIRS